MLALLIGWCPMCAYGCAKNDLPISKVVYLPHCIPTGTIWEVASSVLDYPLWWSDLLPTIPPWVHPLRSHRPNPTPHNGSLHQVKNQLNQPRCKNTEIHWRNRDLVCPGKFIKRCRGCIVIGERVFP
jgi:hypothetical protein